MGEDLPIALSQSAIVVRRSNIIIENPGLVQDVNVKSIEGFHESFGDLIFTVRAPSGKQVTFAETDNVAFLIAPLLWGLMIKP